MVEYPIVVANYTVYVHVNKINQKKYVGITGVTPQVRWQGGRNYKGCTYFNRALNKYGWDNFEHQIIFQKLTYREAIVLEQTLIKALKTRNNQYGYNATDGGEGALGTTSANYVDLTDQKFHRLTVQYRNGTYISPSGVKRTIWHCKCDCGNELDVTYSDLVYNNTKSCGCLNYDRICSLKPNQYDFYGNITHINLDNGLVAIIDTKYYDVVKTYKWTMKNGNVYSAKTKQHKGIQLKKLIYGILSPKIHIDFVNSNPLDCRINNLKVRIPQNISLNDYLYYINNILEKRIYVMKTGEWRLDMILPNGNKHKQFKSLTELLSFLDSSFHTNYLEDYLLYKGGKDNG